MLKIHVSWLESMLMCIYIYMFMYMACLGLYNGDTTDIGNMDQKWDVWVCLRDERERP